MTVNSNYSAYSSYGSSSVASSSQRGKPNFEEMANELIKSMDSDSSGSIDKAEFSAAAQSMATESSSSVSDIFSMLDTNSDGSMSSQELMDALKNMKPPQDTNKAHEGIPPPSAGMPPPPPPSNETESSEDSTSSDVFAALDANKDGVISADEFKALFSKDSSGKTESSSETTASTEQATKDKFESMRDDILKKVLSYYGNSVSATSSGSSLSISA